MLPRPNSSRRVLAGLTLVIAALAVVPANAQQADPKTGARPNIVFLLVDDLGREDCGFMGGKEIRTPKIDRLAAAGARLDAFYVQPVCSPTRAALMTGRYPMRHGLQVGVIRPWASYGLPLEERTLAQALREAGYYTAITGKWHLGESQRDYLPTRRGFDFQYGHYLGAIDCFEHTRDGGFDWHKNDQVCRDEGYSTQLLAREAVRVVEEQSRAKKPFFLYVPFNAVHSPLQSPATYSEPYGALKGPRKEYAAMLAALDESIGQIVDAVDKAGQTERTLFIFSSDNGGPSPGRVTDNGPYRAGKATLYEGGVRVAAFATWPARIKPGVVKEPLHMVDWYPTLLKLAGASAEQKLPVDGLDIWPTLTEGKPTPHASILLNTTPAGGAIRASDWKLVLGGGADDADDEEPAKKKKGGSQAGSVELFQLVEDPYEKNNLAAKMPEKVEELRKKLTEFARQAVPPKSQARPAGFKSPAVWGER